MTELLQISNDIDTGHVSVDVLAEKVKRAYEDEVNAIVAQMEQTK